MDTVLVTGGLGFIGSFVVRELLRRGVKKIIVVDSFSTFINPEDDKTQFNSRKARLKFFDERVIIERCDTCNPLVMSKILRIYEPNIVIHLAALPLAKISNLNSLEAMQGSVSSTSIILEVLGEMQQLMNHKMDKFVYISSSMVYGDFPDLPPDEDCDAKPKEPYGIMKLAGEVITKGLCDFYSIPYSIVRPSAVYGPTDTNRRVSQIFCEKALRGEVINIQGKDEQLDFTYVGDIALGIVEAALNERSNGEVFNITSGNAHTLHEFALVVKEIVGNVEMKITERDSFRPARGTLNIEKAKTLLSFAPRTSLKDGIIATINFMTKGVVE